ncbi:hypothetical protein J6P92_03565 [bacterium]|nr:hypothetical protein [bacterium]
MNLLKLIINIMFLAQIVLIIVIFITAAYWFFDIIGSSLFSFAQPFAERIIDFVKLFYKRDIIVGGVYVDGSLLLFDILSLIAIFLIAKMKYYVYIAQDFFVNQIAKCKQKIEDNFNAQLKKDYNAVIKKYSHAAVLITFVAKNLNADRFWGGDTKTGVSDTEKYVVESFCHALNMLDYVTYKKGITKVAIYLQDFDKIDGILTLIENFHKNHVSAMRKNGWTLDYYCSAATYADGTSVELEIMPKLESLLGTKQRNEIVCFGDFNLRYSLNPESAFYGMQLKGSYELDGGSDVYSFVKKNEAQKQTP